MKISTVLDHIDCGHVALPEFQRGYVWSREQVRGLFDSLYRRHPIGGLLVWVTESKGASHRGDGPLAPGVVKLLLDGQQPVAVLLNESDDTLALASGAGFRCFTKTEHFKAYVRTEILATEGAA